EIEKPDNVRVIVGTDAIGVGINLKNVKVLIMDIPPSVDTFVQRVGRICRDIDNDRDCTVYLLRDGNEDIPKYYLENRDKLGSINWRLPYRCCGKEGYATLINKYAPEPKLDYVAYQDLLSSTLSRIVIEQEDLKRKYRDYCDFVRGSIIIRGITRRNDPLIHSLPLSMEDAKKIIEGHGKEIDIAVYSIHITNKGIKVNPLHVDDGDKDTIIKALQNGNHNECDRYFEINNLINKKYGRSKKYSRSRDFIMWGLDVSQIYRSGIGLVI
ncbi:MAG: helicase-related protein, partial [Vulcanisaeta sp.]